MKAKTNALEALSGLTRMGPVNRDRHIAPLE